tara:strand:+ start:13642 stop:14319 length:678 start_codon:yes stop_codon:yes gene_type:complete
MNVVAVIPARGGSKSIPFKNIYKINGKPLIEYTIETALKSKKIDKVIVSTDNSNIIKVCSKYKSVMIIRRPEEISQDESSTESCLIHVLHILKKDYKKNPKIVLTLEPTSPFRKLETINNTIDFLKNEEIDSVVALKESKECFGYIKNNIFEHFIKNQPRRRQDRKPIYVESSTIYGTLTNTLLKTKSVLGENPKPIIVDHYESIDINEQIDLIIAESIVKFLKI